VLIRRVSERSVTCFALAVPAAVITRCADRSSCVFLPQIAGRCFNTTASFLPPPPSVHHYQHHVIRQLHILSAPNKVGQRSVLVSCKQKAGRTHNEIKATKNVVWKGIRSYIHEEAKEYILLSEGQLRFRSLLRACCAGR
jgi:hypothetical protein